MKYSRNLPKSEASETFALFGAFSAAFDYTRILSLLVKRAKCQNFRSCFCSERAFNEIRLFLIVCKNILHKELLTHHSIFTGVFDPQVSYNDSATD